MFALRLLCVLLVCLVSSSQAAPKSRRAKNVILFLADAGGLATLSAASLHGYNAPQKLFIQSWPHIGLSDTTTASQWVSDSAAGMTAIVTGVKTHNGMISQGPDGVRGKQDGSALKTILEHAEERGLSTGVLSNVTITDATPAACYAHVNDRRKWGDIFLQLFEPRFGDGVDFLWGPGRKAISERVKELGFDLDTVAKEKGRPVYNSLGEIPSDAKRALVVVEGPADLNDAAKKAIRLLSQNRKGYFLMIEADAHTNDLKAGLDRMVAFDRLIREISEMVKEDDTLLLFTADHSFDLRVRSGGPLQPLLTGVENVEKGSKEIRIHAVRVDNTHTGEEVVVAARGPGAERVRGFMSNTDLFRIMMDALGWR